MDLKKFLPWAQTALIIFAAGVAWAGVASNTPRIEKLEVKYENLAPAMARVEQKVDDIKGALNIKHRD